MRQDITFEAGGLRLAGWLYRPDSAGPHPIVVMTHGLGAVKEMGLDTYAEVFVKAGLACLIYDHRNTGQSGGLPRRELDPWQQVNDMRDAVTYASMCEGIDPGRIGLWGTSWSGGHAIVVGALDRRIKCVVSQVPTISGYRNTLRAIPAARFAAFLEEIYMERAARARGESPRYVRISEEGSDGDAWSKIAGKGTSYENSMTLLSRDLRMGYEPGVHISRISPTPLLMIVAKYDVRTPVDDQLQCYSEALEPKKLLIVDGGHYSVYLDKLPEAAAAAKEWLTSHLGA